MKSGVQLDTHALLTSWLEVGGDHRPRQQDGSLRRRLGGQWLLTLAPKE